MTMSSMPPPVTCLSVSLVCAGLISLGALFWVFSDSASGWGGEHHAISEAAILALPRDEQDYVESEKAALVRIYCGFPDQNWPCMGEWGGGVADPKAKRFADARREWDISFYCQWDPVLRKGQGYPHAPPASYEAVSVHFLRAAEAFKAGQVEDAMRIMGVVFHYIQDSGAFGHMQPIHRQFAVRDLKTIRIEGYAPQLLGQTPEAAAKGVAERLGKMVEYTENRVAALFEGHSLSFSEAKQLCGKDTMPPAAVKAVAAIRAQREADFRAAALDCANECARACADTLHTALAFAPKPRPEPPPPPSSVNLVFNPSFEEDDGDGVPDGWCVGWLDLEDRVGRAERYRAGTHWDKPVRTGQFSALILWPPQKGLEWRQTWRRALRVRPGEKYRVAAWVKTRAAAGLNCVALEFYDAAYQPISRATSESATADDAWRLESVEVSVPEKARWARVILHSESSDGAVWFDDVEVVNLR